MKQIFKKLLCSLLAVLMIVSIAPVRAEAADSRAKVGDAEISERIKILENKLVGTYFTANRKTCGNYSGKNHPCNYGGNCSASAIIKNGWFKTEFSVCPKSVNNLCVKGDSMTCVAFARMAHWYIFCKNDTEVDYVDWISSKATFNYTNAKKAKKGDIIVLYGPYNAYHEGILLSVTSSGIKMLECNVNGATEGASKVFNKFTTTYGDLYTSFSIGRATNYVEHVYDKYGYCSHCKKYYEEINKVTSIDGTLSSTDKVKVKPHPYTGDEGVYQDKLNAGTYKIIGKIKNHYENTWYKISYGSSKTGWVYPESNVTVNLTNTINIELNMNKSSIPKGTSVWANDSSKAYNWYGKASSSNGVSKITSLTFEILKADGTLTASTNRITIKPNATSYTVKTSDDTTKFSELAVGSYVLSLSATDENGKTANKKYNFTVYDNASSNVSVTGVNITQTNVTVSKGKTSSLTATVSPSNATNKAVTWSSSNTSVATVSSSGVVTGVSAGTAVITVTTKDGSYKDTCTVTVNPTVYNVNYNLNGGSANISNKEVTEGWYINLPSTVPTRPGYTFEGWQESGTAGTNGWVTTKPASGTYQTGYKYYIWGYECDHCRDYGYNYDVDYTFFYSKNKNDVISGVKENPQVYGSYTPSKLRYFYIIESANKGTSFYPGQSGSTYKYFNADYIAEDGKKGTASIYKTEFYLESTVYKQEATGGKIYQPGDSYNVKNDVTFTAIWKEVKGYNITFDPANGTGGPANMTTNGTEFTVPKEIPVRENWKFLYWMDQHNGKFEPGETVYIFEDRVLTACWAPYWFPEIKVGNTSGKPGETVAVPVYIYNAKEPNNTTVKFSVTSDGLTRTKYENVAVFPENGLFTTVYFEIPKTAKAGTYPVNFNLTEYKVLSGYYLTETVEITNGVITVEEPEKEYTVTFDPGKGTGVPKEMVVSGDGFTVPKEIPVRENWNFIFWMGQNGKGYHPGKTYPIAESLDLVAIFEPGWIPEISIESVKGKPGEEVELSVTMANNKENPEEYSIITGIKPYRDEREDHEFNFTVAELPQNGIIGKISFIIPEDAKAGTVYEVTIRSDKWIVGGFDMAASEMLEFNNGSITVEEPEPQTYTVTYNANGGSGAPSAQTKTENKALTLSTAKPTRSGYEFLGWATSANAGTAQYQPGGSYTANANATLYAVWKKIPVTYTVSYNANGGSGAPSAQTKTENKALTLSTTKPTRNGYEFLGWATSANAGTAQYQPGGSYTANANVTLYAVWKQKEVIPADAPTIIIGEVPGKAGEIVEVPVILKNNPGVAVIGFDIVYDKTAIKLVDYKGTGLDDWLIGVGKGEKANWVDEKGSSFNGEILVLEFEILKEAKDGSAEIAFTNFKAGNKNNEKLNFVIDNGKIEIVSRIPGDSNNDGEVDVFDLLILRKHLAGIPEEINLNASDVNADGEVDVFDLLLFRKYLAGMDAVLK